jgi:RNA-binding protein YlmH
MAKKNQWVIKYGDIWAVKGEGNTKVTKITKTQKEAINYSKYRR